ncbi:VOC family protein [Parabacteroides provencensis]|uniref:VOC family protein n=1 Tax=Parabacteroides provencensis TaxID=1944636 RepID=UPI000C144D9B|nr:VOC family protein [Parabacteroides provencensis]
MKNLIEFIEIPAIDFNRAVKFYETALDLKLTVCDSCESEKMAFFPETPTKPNVAISWASDFQPSKDGVLIHFSVESIETALALANANGGKTVRPKTKIEVAGMGYFAQFSDSEGNTLGLYAEK